MLATCLFGWRPMSFIALRCQRETTQKVWSDRVSFEPTTLIALQHQHLLISSMPHPYHFVPPNTLIFHLSLCLLLDCMVYCDLLLHFLHSLFCDFFDLSLTPNLSISIPLYLISFMDSLSPLRKPFNYPIPNPAIHDNCSIAK